MKLFSSIILTGLTLFGYCSISSAVNHVTPARSPATEATIVPTGGVQISSVDCDLKINGKSTLNQAKLEITVYHVNPADPLVLTPYSLRYQIDQAKNRYGNDSYTTFGFLTADRLNLSINTASNWVGSERTQRYDDHHATVSTPRIMVSDKVSGAGPGGQDSIFTLEMNGSEGAYAFTCQMNY